MDRKAKAFKNAENKKNLIKSQTDSGNFISTNFKTVSPATSSFRSLPSPSTTRTYSLTSTGSNYPWSVRASSVPLSPTTNPTQFTRSSSAKEDSSGRENDDRDSARKLIKNLVTIFSHSRSPTSSSESSRESSIVSLQDKKTLYLSEIVSHCRMKLRLVSLMIWLKLTYRILYTHFIVLLAVHHLRLKWNQPYVIQPTLSLQKSLVALIL